MNRTRHYIGIMLMMLLFAGGSINEAWAKKTVTYHIITLPFGDNTGYIEEGVVHHEQYRIEAIKCEVVYDNLTDPIGLPTKFKSPLMNADAYTYWANTNTETNVIKSELHTIFINNPSTFYTYTFPGSGSSFFSGTTVKTISDLVEYVGDQNAYDVYVTYEWSAETKSDYGRRIDLEGKKLYNIEFTEKNGSGSWFYALNMDEGRGNRGQAVPKNVLKNIEDLCSDDIVQVKEDVGGSDRKKFFFKWKFVNNDPYNIILQTAWENDTFIYNEPVDNNNRFYWKNSVGAQLFGNLAGTGGVKGNFLTNEMNKAWPLYKTNKNDKPTSEEVRNSYINLPGWYRGSNKVYDPHPGVEAMTPKTIIPDANVMGSNLYFSFTLLNHNEQNYTLVASWVDVNGNKWVPNSGKYLHMKHTPSTAPYAGPAFDKFDDADQVRIYEVRDYTYKVKTPISNTILEEKIRMSDFVRTTPLTDRIPSALKRKYATFTGTYADEALTTSRTTFEDVYENDEPEITKNRDIWLKYTTSMPFEAGTTATTFKKLKWYNIYANKEERYITWYDTDTSNAPPSPNQFSTNNGGAARSKYEHESHFAFVGDPYELYVVSRKASDNNNEQFRYLSLDATKTNPLVPGAFNAYNAVSSLTAGDTYYTSSNGGGKFIADGSEVADENTHHYYQKVYTPVANGTSITAGNIYYTSSTGDGEFKAPALANGSNYYEIAYAQVTSGTALIAGNTYYTSNTGDGKFIANPDETAGANCYKIVYNAVSSGTTLTPGKTYYTSATGDGEFIAIDPTSTISYYEKVYIAVAAGTTLTVDNTYYTSSTGDGEFTATGSEVANGSNYFVAKYTSVAFGKKLKNGKTYYTSDTGGGGFTATGNEVNRCYYERKFNEITSGTTLTAGNIYYTSNTGDGQFTAVGNESSPNYEEANVWEIIYDDNSGDNSDCFRLRQFGTYDSPVYIGWTKNGKYPLNGNTTPVRLSVLELPMMTYTYYIIDQSNNIAVMATAEQVTGTTLSYETIPEVIRSPFIQGAHLTFFTYDSSAKTTYNTQIHYTNSMEGDANEYKNHIFVKYTDLNSTYTALINGSINYNVLLNNEYLYIDYAGDTYTTTTPVTINSSSSLIGSSLNGNNLWVLDGSDPYAMIIKNKVDKSNSTVAEHAKYVKVASWSDGDLTWGNYNESNEAARFIIKSGPLDNTYEVMATTGVTKDASITYYNMGRVTETDNSVTVKMYDNKTYPHGYAQIRFQLKQSTATQVVYHLIDKSNKELLTETARHAVGDEPVIPVEIFSPLVGYENYTYWKSSPVEDNTAIAYTKNEKFTEKVGDVGGVPTDIWITYNANDLVDMNHTTMYLLKYEQGDRYRQENGSDGLLPKPTKAENQMTEEEKAAYIKTYQAVYPYCNGDGNFFVYGQQQYETQQEGAASTRTRWAWYIESGNHDPYHVKILSRQTETYDGLERSAYFSTRKFEGWDKVVTGLVWPNISGVQATEYMVLGNVGQYQLVTTPVDTDKDGVYEKEEDLRYVVDSFEQYWKTYDTVKKKLLSDLLPNCLEKDRTDRVDGSIEVPTEPASLRERLTGTGEGQYGFHSYQKMANAKRWNGYNASGEKKKGWETREHWFQTVKMGSGYFDLIPTVISPALILLDQHGWEIMRKPLPYSDQDPDKEKKKDVLRAYDSPMVKEYIYWASAKKRSGLHQYYLMDKRIGGSTYSSTSLGDLPPWGSENVVDNKGNQYDEYVTYIVKEEYAISYDPTTQKGTEFLIRQGTDLAKNNNNGVGGNKVSFDPDPGSVSQYIINNISTLGNELWYVKPNADIDNEMGYGTTSHDWGTTNPNAYEDAVYGKNQVAQIITNSADVTKYGKFSFSNGFDPYNIQISSITGATPLYFTTGMTSANVSEGTMVGTYGSTAVTLAEKATTTVVGNGYDNSKWAVTNQTFMAVQDLDGNMQLMPRFDHNLRMRDFATLVTPTAEAEDEDKLKETYTQLYRPFVYNYRIIDNEGHESLRYQSGGDLLPQTADHLKSPLAKDFKYYKDLNYNDGTKTYTEIANKNNISSKEITTSLVGAGLKTSGVTNSNIVYVRYTYDEDADVQHVLQGKWLTMKLNEKDAVYNGGIKQFDTGNGATKPNPIVGNIDKGWQWKFLRHPYTDPDPYAVQMFNRNATDLPMRTPSLNGGTVGTSTSENDYQRFALLSHEEGGYALTVAGTELLNYYFLNGNSMTTIVPAITAEETGVTGAVGNFDGTKSQILLTDEVVNDYTYKVYTHGRVEAISETQTHDEAADNNFVPQLPEAIKTPLLNYDQFRYYEALTDTAYNSGLALKNLYGLYDNEVFVRYNAYDQNVSEYKVPNDRNEPGDGSNHKDPVAKGNKSNDAPLRLDNVLPHNIIWYDDNMMKADGSSIGSDADKELQNADAYAWRFGGDDPYAIKIWHKNSNQYVHEGETTTCSTCGGTGLVSTETCSTCHGSKSIIACNLDATPTTFMLLDRDGYEYGVFAVTGHKEKMLTENGNQLTATDRAPNKFIIFSLGTLKVIYHLVLANIGDYKDIPYRHRTTGEKTDPNYSTENDEIIWNKTDGYYTDDWAVTDTLRVNGTTKRELTNTAYQLGDDGGVSYPQLDGTYTTTYYCKDVGPISLGDGLTVPEEFYRPNVNYFFVVNDINDATLNKQYKGLQITSKEMSLNEDLIGKTIYIDILYRFNTDLESNSGDNFVMSVDQNKWYTLETIVKNKTYLAQYTNAWGFELKEGRGSHYTNDFLWTPIGDPYGFQLMNRYMDVNSGDHNLGEKNRAITTIPYRTKITTTTVNNEEVVTVGEEVAPAFEDGKQIVMGNYVENNGQRVVVPGGVAHTDIPYTTIKTNSIYELLEGQTSGFFHFHPVANTSEQPQVYFNPIWADDDRDGVDNYLVRLKTTAAEFTFGLSAELLKPYFDRAGYVGGLTKDAYNKAENAALVAAMKNDNPVLTSAQLMAAQELVYDSKNIVQLENGYYRLHSPLGISGIDPVRYVSGYTHKIELGYTDEKSVVHAPIPMHFYEKNSSEVRQFTDFKDGGFTYSNATRGDITIPPVEKDPASIFYFEKIADGEIPTGVPTADKDRYNLGTFSTQGLYVKGEKGQVTIIPGSPPSVNDQDPNKETTGERPAALMTETKGEATKLFVMDLGGGVLLIHDNVTGLGRRYLKYLSFDYSNDTQNNPTIYDMKLTNHTHTDHAKFCMQPVQDTETKGINEMPLKLDLKQDKRNNYYYASFYAPFDVLLTDADNDMAFICKVWDTEILHLKKVGHYNTGDNCPADYKGSNQFVPAGTPVIIRSNKSVVTLALPTKTPSTTLAESYKNTVENIFMGEYLEQLLPPISSHTDFFDVYTFGYPMTAKDVPTKNYVSGEIVFDQQHKSESDMGFYINATPNREYAADMGSWIRNNRYVYGNKIYYRIDESSNGAPQRTNQYPDFIPVVFDDDEDEDIEDDLSGAQRIHDNRVYDLQGRCVATEQEVKDGTWKLRLPAGVYILNGQKVMTSKR